MGKECNELKAYAVFAGGGVKALALAGALVAAQESGIQFVGYGGTSAGAIIALLAAVGYSGPSLANHIRKDTTFTQFLEDGGSDLATIQEGLARIRNTRSFTKGLQQALLFYMRHKSLVDRIFRDNGIDSGTAAKNVLTSLVTQACPTLRDKPITFASLAQAIQSPTTPEPPLLKVVATDVRRQQQVVFPDPKGGNAALDASVIDAVFASMSYPLLYSPSTYDGMVLVDGGLSSNFPFFLFRDEQQQTGYPIIAFELIDDRDWDVREYFDVQTRTRKYSAPDFGLRLFSTALASTDRTNRREMDGVYFIPVPVNSDITLRPIPEQAQRGLFGQGYYIARPLLQNIARFEAHTPELLRKKQKETMTLLRAFMDHIKAHFRLLENCRTYIMLPTNHNTRRIEYQLGMNGQIDEHMETGIDKGATGAAWESRETSVLDLRKVRASLSSQAAKDEYGMLPPETQQTILTAPLRNFRSLNHIAWDTELPLLGTLSLDTETDLDTIDERLEQIQAIVELWARIIAKHLWQ